MNSAFFLAKNDADAAESGPIFAKSEFLANVGSHLARFTVISRAVAKTTALQEKPYRSTAREPGLLPERTCFSVEGTPEKY